MLETTVTGFLYDGAGEINGVTAQRYDGTTVNVKAEAVILATGGFAGNEELVTKYCGYPYQQFGMTHNKGTGLAHGPGGGGQYLQRRHDAGPCAEALPAGDRVRRL